MGVPGRHAGHRAPRWSPRCRRCPQGATWSATGIGRTTLPVALAALSAGGHLRVGMEDTLTFAAGEPVRDNAELVERAADAGHAGPAAADDHRTRRAPCCASRTARP